MKGTEVKEFLRLRGFSVSRVAELLGDTRQNLTNMLSKDDVRTGLVESIARVTEIPLLEFYGQRPAGPSVSGDGNVVNNGHDQVTADPSLVGVIQEQQRQMAQLIEVIKDLAKK